MGSLTTGPRKSLNILYVGSLPPHPGGSTIVGSQLVVGFSDLGHRVRALAPVTAEGLEASRIFAAQHRRVGVTRYPVPYFETSPEIPLPDDYLRSEGEQIRKSLNALITEERPDIIVIGRGKHGGHVPKVALDHSIPCIMIVHGGTIFGILNSTIPRRTAQRLVGQYRKVNGVVTVAEHLVEPLRRLGLDDVRVIPNGVDLNQFRPGPRNRALLEELEIPHGDVIVVHASNMKPLKRCLDIVQSAEEALRRKPDLVYVIVGDGDCLGEMKQACHSSHVAKDFRFVGWVDYDHMPDYINLADIVVMPSEAEAQALVYLEAQACGRVLVASDIPGAREVIDNGETGLLFRKGDVGDLTAKTLLAAGDEKLRAAIGRKARERVKLHNVTRTIAAYEATLKSVVKEYRR